MSAHRGGAADAPENTLYAMLLGLAHGATHLEVDVRATRDRIPVCMHDRTAERTCGADAEVASLTLRELQGLDPGAAWPDLAGIATGERPAPAGFEAEHFRVPTLDDVLRVLPGVPIMIDLKDTAPIDSVANVVRNWNRTDDVLLQGYDDVVLNETAARLPGVPRAAGRAGTQTFYETGDTDAQAVVVPTSYEGLELVEPDVVDRAHAQGAGFWVWTVNDAELAAELLAMGVDGLITDAPGTVAPVRERRLRGAAS